MTENGKMKLLKTVAITLVITAITAFASEITVGGNEYLPDDGKNDGIIDIQTPEKSKAFELTESSDMIDLNEISVSAKSAILCTSDGLVLYEKQADVPLPMASITKVMTAIVALESIEDTSVCIEVPIQAVGTEGSSVYLKKGEKVTLEMLLYSAMLESANDATVALAIAVAGSEESFVKLMNEKASALKMENTAFANPHGLPSSEHYTTCEDYARLMAYALENDAFREIISTKKKIYPSEDGSLTRVLTNHNRLLNTYGGMIGGKTGFTKTSGRTLVTAAERNGTTLICVTINASDDWNDHTELFNKGFQMVSTQEFLCEQEIPIACGKKETLKCALAEKVAITAENGSKITVEYVLPRFMFAPVKKGQRVGYAVFYRDGKELFRKEMYATEAAVSVEAEPQKRGAFEKIKEFFKWKS